MHLAPYLDSNRFVQPWPVQYTFLCSVSAAVGTATSKSSFATSRLSRCSAASWAGLSSSPMGPSAARCSSAGSRRILAAWRLKKLFLSWFRLALHPSSSCACLAFNCSNSDTSLSSVSIPPAADRCRTALNDCTCTVAGVLLLLLLVLVLLLLQARKPPKTSEITIFVKLAPQATQ